jgi:hypothetical protein
VDLAVAAASCHTPNFVFLVRVAEAHLAVSAGVLGSLDRVATIFCSSSKHFNGVCDSSTASISQQDLVSARNGVLLIISKFSASSKNCQQVSLLCKRALNMKTYLFGG